jgi:hypothetical protein
VDYPIRFALGDDQDWWNNWEGLVYGKVDNNFYLEDNTFSVSELAGQCQYGNRYAYRYNTIVSNYASGAYPLFDLHGDWNWGTGAYWSCFGAELYGNDISVQGDGGYVMDQRGGMVAAFYNKVTGKNVGFRIREEQCDSLCPTTNPQPQHPSGSYQWANYKTLPAPAMMGFFLDSNACGSYTIRENKEYWNYSPTYDGTVPGVGCGSSRPAVCATGDGYWETSQSCSDLTGLIGASHTSNITGTFYRCTATNTWTSYFTPLAYPHPLRGPSAPTELIIKK